MALNICMGWVDSGAIKQTTNHKRRTQNVLRAQLLIHSLTTVDTH